MVVMSDDMNALCKQYENRRTVFSKDNEYFFPSWNGGVFTNLQLQSFFKDCWKRANPNIGKSDLPKVRVYDLRHRFASAVLNKWLDGGKNLSVMLPYLRAYMGHNSLNETAYYVHLLPENLVKSAGINWAEFGEIMPEVTLWTK